MTTPDVSGGQPAVDAMANRYADIIGTDDQPTQEPEKTPEPVKEVKPTEDVKPEADKEESEEEANEERKPKKGGYTRKLERLEARIAELTEKLAGSKAPEQSAPKADEAEPNPDDFDDYNAYYKALVKFELRQELKQAEKAKQETTVREQREQLVSSYKAKAQEFAKTTPDFQEVIESADVPVTPVMQQVLLESEMGPQLAYYLAKNPDEADKAVKMGLVELSRFMGRIEAKLEAEAEPKAVVKKATNAPEPIKPVSNAKTAKAWSLDDKDIPYEEYVRLRGKR